MGGTVRLGTLAPLVLIVAMGGAVYAGCSSTSDETPTDGGTKSDAPAPVVDSGADVVVDAAPADAHNDAFDCAASLTAGGGVFPMDLRCAGLYSDWATKTVDAKAVAFTPGYTLWSDGALKQRWISIPAGTKIDTSDMDEWVFPVGTRIWKEFALGGKRIETRIFTKLAATAGQGIKNWDYTVYRWSDDETSATKMEGGEQEVNGTKYQIPPKAQCSSCHNGRLDVVLGFDAISLSGANAAGLTLAGLMAADLLSAPPVTAPLIPEDTTGSAREAFGWLHSNCGTSCHNANPTALATGSTLPKFRVSAKDILAATAAGAPLKVTHLDGYTTTVNKASQYTEYAAYVRIKPNDPTNSLVSKLAGSRKDPVFRQMPPILSNIADQNGVNKVNVWIANMPPIVDGG